MEERNVKMALLVFLLIFALRISANETIGSSMNEYYKVLALAGIVERPALMYHSLSRNRWQPPQSDIDHPWKTHMEGIRSWNQSSGANWNVISPKLLSSYNSSYAFGSNDGALWQGKGANGMLSGGVNLTWRWISLTLCPEIWFAQNQAFALMPSDPDLSEYSYPVWNDYKIDKPQRFGATPIFAVGFGQSDARLNIGRFTMGFTSENMWFGPGQANSILMTNNAAGFPHLDMGIRKVHTPIGDVELNLVWGSLKESGYFDTIGSNDYRLFSSLTFGYNPSFLKDLVLGASRVVYTPWEDLGLYDLLKMLDPRMIMGIGTDEYPGRDDRDQMISFTIDWFLRESTFNVYLEWARNDYSPTLRSALQYIQHSQGYLLGFRKLIPLNDQKIISVTAELIELVRTKEIAGVCPSYYKHHVVIQGYTNLGQLLAAGIGPGSNSQFFKADYYNHLGRLSFIFQRVVYDMDYFFEAPALPYSENTEWTFGIDGVFLLKALDIGYLFAVSSNWNRNYVLENDVVNFHGAISLQYNL